MINTPKKNTNAHYYLYFFLYYTQDFIFLMLLYYSIRYKESYDRALSHPSRNFFKLLKENFYEANEGMTHTLSSPINKHRLFLQHSYRLFFSSHHQAFPIDLHKCALTDHNHRTIKQTDAHHPRH